MVKEKISTKIKTLFMLFRLSFSISAFTFGGGYVVIPMVRKHFVEKLKLISEEQLLEIAAIAQSTPGAIAVNISVLVGYKIMGLKGSIVCCIGTILPPLIILTIISYFYTAFRNNKVIAAVLKGMEAGIAAIIVDVLIDMFMSVIKQKNYLLTLLAPLAFIANFVFKVNVLIIILSTVVLCLMQSLLKRKKEKDDK